METETLMVGDAVQVYSDYHMYYFVSTVDNGKLVAQDETSFTVEYTYGERQRIQRFDNLDNYHLEAAEPKAANVRRCVECGIEMTSSTCEWCGGF